MIAVIADDLTGAAEIAGIGLEHQLKTEVTTVVEPDSTADLLIVTMNSRGLPKEEARAISIKVTTQLLKLQPNFIYKKIDSVLRGNILEETKGQIEASGLTRALIIPGNPMHQKIAVDGVFYYKGSPVHESAYAIDPEYPLTSSEVKAMLRAGDEVTLLKAGEAVAADGIFVGNIASETDYQHWIKQLNNQTLLVGAAGLFEAVLKQRTLQKGSRISPGTKIANPKLFVFGSTFYQGKQRPEAGFKQMAWNFLPVSIVEPGADECAEVNEFITAVANGLKDGKNSIIALNPDDFKALVIDPKALAISVAIVVKQIIARAQVKEILIEGGATAAAIIKKLGVTRMLPEQQLSAGVIRLSVPGNAKLNITLKPGSYEWPALALV